LFLLTIVEETSNRDEDRSDRLEDDTISYDDILIKENESSNRVENHEREEEKGYT
jgi:hypothetical protein